MTSLHFILTVPAFKFWIQKKLVTNLTDNDWDSIWDYEKAVADSELGIDYVMDNVEDMISKARQRMLNKHFTS